MRLYHGTTEAVARAALAQGLAPRSLTQAKGNWDKHPSNPHAVYLTTAYAGYFAACASDDGNKWGLVEIETDLLDVARLVPDEDWLEQVSRTQAISGLRAKSITRRHARLRVRSQVEPGHGHARPGPLHFRDELCLLRGKVPRADPVVLRRRRDPW